MAGLFATTLAGACSRERNLLVLQVPCQSPAEKLLAQWGRWAWAGVFW